MQEEQENDKLKKKLAKENGIENYIVIDCRYSELEYIKNNILKSKLNKLFDLNNIDWLKCGEFALSSLVLKTCDLWNNGTKDTKEISTQLKINRGTAIKYLTKGAKLGLCDYFPHASRKRRYIKCLENDYVFKSSREASKLSLKIYGKYISRGGIMKSCENRTLCKGLNFRYIT